jgi:hypothetical protein
VSDLIRKAGQTLWLLGALCLLASSNELIAGDRPMFRVGDKMFTIKDLTGHSEEQLRERFRAETKFEFRTFWAGLKAGFLGKLEGL